MEALHLLRPLWLLAILPALLLTWFGLRARSGSANWQRAIAPELLEYLLDRQTEPQQHRAWWVALCGWLLACLALAGPTWEKLPQPVLQNREALVIALDLSLSMNAADIQPSRLQRARYKILDILKRRHDGLTGLVVYAGDAHVVTPLTDDVATIENLVPALAPDMMPVYGSDVGAGIAQAIQLLQSAGVPHGRILLLTDGIEARDIDAIANQLRATHHDFSILGIGTEQGAPIPLNGEKISGPNNANGFLKQRDGSIVIPQLRGELLEQLAAQTRGSYHPLSVDDTDLDALLPTSLPADAMLRSTEREFDQWRERGPWLAVMLLPLAALAFRRGWLLIIFAAALMLPDTRSIADEIAATNSSPTSTGTDRSKQFLPDQFSHNQVWRNLWSTPDQQAAQALAAGDAKTAAQKFSDPAWRASALYRAGDYEQAAKDFQTLHDANGNVSADADYNRGVALARAGQLEESLHAFDDALKKNPAMADAKFNRKIVEQLLKQQQKTEPDNQTGDPSGDQKEQNQSTQNQSNAQQSQDKTSDKASAAHSSGEHKPNADAGSSADKLNNSQQKNASDASTQKQAEPTQPDQKAQKTPAQAANDKQKKVDEGSANTKAESKEKADEKITSANQTGANDKPALTPEQQRQQQVMEQWLRQIPDDPSGLLRRKFDYEHQQHQRDSDRNSDSPAW